MAAHDIVNPETMTEAELDEWMGSPLDIDGPCDRLEAVMRGVFAAELAKLAATEEVRPVDFQSRN